jgi:3-isopropylmalate dehydrogenase
MDIANPLATILSVAMMMRYTFGQEEVAQRIEAAVRKTLQLGLRTGDIYQDGMQKVGTAAMGDAVVKAL